MRERIIRLCVCLQIVIMTAGKYDPTAYNAIRNVSMDEQAEEEKFKKLLGTIFNLCELSGFHLEERIVVKNKRTGRIWR